MTAGSSSNDFDIDLQVTDVALGLEYLHENGIVHGNLKGVRLVPDLAPDHLLTKHQLLPEQQKNVLVGEDGHAVLADFGITSILDPDGLVEVSISSSMSQDGTARWRAPETFSIEEDEESLETKASDVYAFAMVTYEVCQLLVMIVSSKGHLDIDQSTPFFTIQG